MWADDKGLTWAVYLYFLWDFVSLTWRASCSSWLGYLDVAVLVGFLLPCILWTQGKKEMHTYIWQRLCSENFQLNLLLAPFSFFLFVDAIYYSNVGRVEPSGALLSLIILWD